MQRFPSPCTAVGYKARYIQLRLNCALTLTLSCFLWLGLREASGFQSDPGNRDVTQTEGGTIAADFVKTSLRRLGRLKLPKSIPKCIELTRNHRSFCDCPFYCEIIVIGYRPDLSSATFLLRSRQLDL